MDIKRSPDRDREPGSSGSLIDGAGKSSGSFLAIGMVRLGTAWFGKVGRGLASFGCASIRAGSVPLHSPSTVSAVSPASAKVPTNETRNDCQTYADFNLTGMTADGQASTHSTEAEVFRKGRVRVETRGNLGFQKRPRMSGKE